jgi:hypothetical protein
MCMADGCDGSAYKHVLRSGFPLVQVSRRLSSISKCLREAGPSSTALTIVYAEDRHAILEGERLHAMRMVATSCRIRARVLVALVGVVLVEDSGRSL